MRAGCRELTFVAVRSGCQGYAVGFVEVVVPQLHARVFASGRKTAAALEHGVHGTLNHHTQVHALRSTKTMQTKR